MMISSTATSCRFAWKIVLVWLFLLNGSANSELSSSQDCTADQGPSFSNIVLVSNSQGDLNAGGFVVKNENTGATVTPDVAISGTIGVDLVFRVTRPGQSFQGYLARVNELDSNPFTFFIGDSVDVGAVSFCSALGLLDSSTVNLSPASSLASARLNLSFSGTRNFSVQMNLVMSTTSGSGSGYDYYYDTFLINLSVAGTTPAPVTPPTTPAPVTPPTTPPPTPPPTPVPTPVPTPEPTPVPTQEPTPFPTGSPVNFPTTFPPTTSPVNEPTTNPTTANPTTANPTTTSPTEATAVPTTSTPSPPSSSPVTSTPSLRPVSNPTTSPTTTHAPTKFGTTPRPSNHPTQTQVPTVPPKNSTGGGGSSADSLVSDGSDVKNGGGDAMIIAILACLAGVMILLLAVLFVRWKRRRALVKADLDQEISNEVTAVSSRETPGMDVIMGIDDDEVSALGTPSVFTYDDADQSLSTMDYDYAKVIKANKSVVSRAAGTLGGDTQTESFAQFGNMGLGAGQQSSSRKWAEDTYTFASERRRLGAMADDELTESSAFFPPVDGVVRHLMDEPDEELPSNRGTSRSPAPHKRRQNLEVRSIALPWDPLETDDDEEESSQ